MYRQPITPALPKKLLNRLAARAIELGATAAAPVPSANILVEDALARLCVSPGCPWHGLSASCPPTVEGPEAFRAWVAECDAAVVLRLDVPASAIYSGERLGIMAFLHEIVAEVERSARDLGLTRSRAFAGGSCKELFCSDFSDCRELKTNGGCRNPDRARPSMSGFGINVNHLMHAANWPERQLNDGGETEQSMSWVAGLILVG